ncbi:unnamed protein product [Didymodactylos carnosus]|uniref:OTU domain-containing protein n=1 Tax=Didymodactylos carnosus TaxID=1234261 RepID=A0A813TB83_9BILA|nr:unnamed protein product [Didymodactylos carnosus]CAF0885133.1 unnamed protein product [Didymodactylos carnosus]CAF3597096.1 unnamed protein product [Didymodactylos carnosus]CAF3668231.1 unnamed protein product [Didymodactylos carnosus]
MENLDRLGYDMLEIQSTSTNQKNNHFKAIAKSLLLTMEINDWLNDYICSILHITNGQDLNFTKHLRKLCTKEWQKHYDNYKKMWIDKYPNNNTKAFDFQNEIEKFRSEDYYRLDMCFLVNQALANAFGIPIYIIRGIREENPVETIKPLFIARSGVNIVLISSQKNDGHYDVAVLKGHPQTLKKHRNVTFDEKPEIRSFKADDEQIRPTGLPNASQTPTMNNLSTMRQPNNGLILNTGTQFYPQFTLPTTIYPFNNYFLQPYMPQMMPTPNNDVKLSPSLTRTTSPNPKHTNMNNSTTNTSLTVPTTMPMVLQTPAGLSTMSYGTPTPYMQLPPTQTTFMYNTGMHQSNVPTVSPGTFFYTTSPYSI